MEKYVQKYPESIYLTLVKHFHEVSGNEWQDEPGLPSQKRLELRAHLITEEAREFEQAIKDKDLVESADALIDLLYVVFGSIGELGLSDICKELFEEVHRSNMTKHCSTVEEAKETIEWYAQREAPNRCIANYKPHQGKFIVYRVSDGKTLKSKRYSKVDLSAIIYRNFEETGIDDESWAKDLEDE
jgi:hypothetical protein